MSETVIFQAIQFNINIQFRYIWLMDKTQSDATTPGHSGSRSDSNEMYSTFPKAPELLEPNHQII